MSASKRMEERFFFLDLRFTQEYQTQKHEILGSKFNNYKLIISFIVVK